MALFFDFFFLTFLTFRLFVTHIDFQGWSKIVEIRDEDGNLPMKAPRFLVNVDNASLICATPELVRFATGVHEYLRVNKTLTAGKAKNLCLARIVITEKELV